PDRHPGEVFGAADRRLGRDHDGARRHRVGRGHQVAGPLAGGGVRGPVTGTAHVGAAAPDAERLERARLDLAGFVPLHGTHSVVAVDDEAVLQPFRRKVVLLLGDPFLQSTVRHDLQRHQEPPLAGWPGQVNVTWRLRHGQGSGRAASRQASAAERNLSESRSVTAAGAMTATPRADKSVTLAMPCERRHAAYADSAGRAGAGPVDCWTVAVPPEGAAGGAGAREHAAASSVTPVTATASTAPATAWPAGTRTGGSETGRRRAVRPARCACP